MINGMSVPALLGLKGMKKVNKKEYYKTDGTYRELTKDDLMATSDFRRLLTHVF